MTNDTTPDTKSRLTRYDIGEFVLDLERGELRRGGTPVTLRPKAFAVLRYLVEHGGRLVAKDELLRAVWGRRVVTDASVAKCLTEIRSALDDRSHALVRTVHGRGYRFDGEVRASAVAGGAAPIAAARAAAAPNWQASRPVPTAAAAVRESTTPATPPAARMRRAAGRIGAAALAMTMALVALLAPTGIGRGNGPIAVGTAAAVRSVRQDCARSDELASTPACRDYLQARYYYQRRAPGDIDRAEHHFLDALRADPAQAAAWTGLAAIYLIRSDAAGDGGTVELRRAREALANALALDPTLPEAHARLGSYYARRGDPRRALASFNRALALGPTDANTLAIAAGLALDTGDFTRAVELQQRAVAVNPLAPMQQANLAQYLLAAGRRAEAIAALEDAIALTGRTAGGLAMGVELLMLQGRTPEARRAASRLAPSTERDALLVLLDEGAGRSAVGAAAFARLRRSEASEAAVVRAESLAWHGAIDDAFAALREAHERVRATHSARARALLAGRMNASAYLAPLRADPRWRAVVPACNVVTSDAEAAQAAASDRDRHGVTAAWPRSALGR